ncbi:piggyBac transposable element-derived protein 3-like [Ixodes scapularis]|uniref:piggyBac transposable element-derived protein 3-like n=1 Tax=Ixodes scapularis TaxID=6945 RepID=UPI001C37F81D|nr:piggyBac transposable element-derived protein 3-like [Ixodes scapularis]
MIDALRYQANLYSTQRNGNCISVTHEEMRKYLSILVISGIVRMPHFRMFWQSGTRFAPVADLMSRNRFEAIHQCLHMNDNLQALPQGTDSYDCLFKVRPLLDELRKNMSKVAPDERQNIDEQIIPFKGRSHLKQYLKSKPHKWGYKVFTRASSSGIMHDLIIYEGKGTASDNGFGISGDIVIDLAKTLPQHVNHKLFFDNWFTSLRLVDELKTKGFHCIGTVRADRTEKCPLSSDAALKAQGRGSVDFRMDEKTENEVIKWFDNNCVTLVSSYAGVHPTDTCKRWNSKDKCMVDVLRPLAVKEYNTFMGGVDLADMLIELYRTDHKLKKWYIRIFYWIIDVSIVNG